LDQTTVLWQGCQAKTNWWRVVPVQREGWQTCELCWEPLFEHT